MPKDRRICWIVSWPKITLVWRLFSKQKKRLGATVMPSINNHRQKHTGQLLIHCNQILEQKRWKEQQCITDLENNINDKYDISYSKLYQWQFSMFSNVSWIVLRSNWILSISKHWWLFINLIYLFILLGIRPDPSQIHQPLLVCTAHLHWDPQYCDVKLVQTMMLLNEVQ